MVKIELSDTERELKMRRGRGETTRAYNYVALSPQHSLRKIGWGGTMSERKIPLKYMYEEKEKIRKIENHENTKQKENIWNR